MLDAFAIRLACTAFLLMTTIGASASMKAVPSAGAVAPVTQPTVTFAPGTTTVLTATRATTTMTPTAQLAPKTPVPSPPWSGLPLRTTTKARISGDPVNIAFEGSRSAIVHAFGKVGWLVADNLSVKHDLRLVRAALTHHTYPTAPVSNLYLFGRPEDFAVERERGSVAQRDHARFWDTGQRDPGTHLELWIGDCSQDIGIEILRHKGVPVGTTHHINPNLDAERDAIVALMRKGKLLTTTVVEHGVGLTTNGRNGGGDLYTTDGNAVVVVLTTSP